MFKVSFGLVTFGLLLVSLESLACPKALQEMASPSLPKQYGSLCQMADRYQAAYDRLQLQGIANPERIADLRVPRFVMLSTWENQREDHNYNPVNIYKNEETGDSDPRVWNNWDRAATALENEARHNLTAQREPLIFLQTISDAHKAAMEGLYEKFGAQPGMLRQNYVVGMQLTEKTSVTLSEAQAIERLEYRFTRTGEPLLRWVPVKCVSRYNSVVFNESEWKEENVTFTKSGVTRQCGYIKYVEAARISESLQDFVNDHMKTLDSFSSKEQKADALLMASRVQRWVVSIHPFFNGNGRIARLMMDYALNSLGLPTPILSNHSDDLYKSESEWAAEIAHGMIRTIEIMEACGKRPNAKECRVI